MFFYVRLYIENDSLIKFVVRIQVSLKHSAQTPSESLVDGNVKFARKFEK